MKEDIKYPYIGKLKDGCEGGFTIFISECFGAQLDDNAYGWRSENIFVYNDGWLEDEFKNITREYLANTYGKVESKEHAEFIVELAENHGYQLKGSFHEGDDSYFHFVESKKILFFSSGFSDAKLITIPMPPKEVEVVDEWPKVGDEVIFTDLLQHYEQYKEDYCGKVSKVIARFKYEQGEFITVHREHCAVMTVRVDIAIQDGVLVKPKPPEEELRDDLFSCKKPRLDTMQASDLASWLLDNFNITKKQ